MIDMSGIKLVRQDVFDELTTRVDAIELDESGLNVGSNAGAHNAIYRGKNLGSEYTSEQQAMVQAGTFDDLFIGDYWEIDDVIWRIAAFDYYLGTGDTETTQHHVTIVPDKQLYTHRMNATNTTEGGYVGSEMYEGGLNQAKTIIESAFPGRILNHRQYLANAAVDGESSGWAAFDSEVELMSEVMVYGSSIRTEKNNYRDAGLAKSQLPLFRHRHDLIGIRQSWWLRDVVSATLFATVGSLGDPAANYATTARGVRPAFSII